MKTLLIPDSERYATLNSQELRESFLLENLFAFGKLELVYCDAERTVVGGCVPRGDSIALPEIRRCDRTISWSAASWVF